MKGLELIPRNYTWGFFGTSYRHEGRYDKETSYKEWQDAFLVIKSVLESEYGEVEGIDVVNILDSKFGRHLFDYSTYASLKEAFEMKGWRSNLKNEYESIKKERSDYDEQFKHCMEDWVNL